MNAIAPILEFGVTPPGAPAVVHGSRTITYGELATLTARTASRLMAIGLVRGDRIGLCLKDTADHIVALLGVARMGGVAVSLDWRAKPKENAEFIQALGLACVLAEPGARLPDGCPVVLLNEEWHRDVAQSAEMTEAGTGWDAAPFVISATSGSTGTPKFTWMTHRQYTLATAGMFELMDLAGEHRFLCTLPLYYSGGRNSVLTHLLRGDCVVLYPSLFDHREYCELVVRHKITVGTLVPSTVRQFLAAAAGSSAADGPMLPSLSKLFCTGAPLHPEEKRDAVRLLSPNFHERYGTAETLAISVLRPNDLAERADSVGHPHSLAQIEIVDDEGHVLPAGEIGRLRFRGPGLASPMVPDGKFVDGAFYPGEIARLDEAGYIFLHGRSSEIIMRSGAKIFPAEIERALAEHPSVAEAAVFGYASEGGEERVVAFVVCKQALSAGELLAHCRARLTPHKVPQAIHLLAELPRNTAGKVDKPALMRLMTVSREHTLGS